MDSVFLLFFFMIGCLVLVTLSVVYFVQFLSNLCNLLLLSFFHSV